MTATGQMIGMTTSPLVAGGAFDAAKRSRRDKDWDLYDLDPNEVIAADGHALGARSSELLRNNAIVNALINALKDGVIGPDGLRFVSLFSTLTPADYYQRPADLRDRIVAEEQLRDAVDNCIRLATRGRSIDAQGLLTMKGLQELALGTKATYGNFYLERVHKPDRPGMHSHATCFRVIHPARRCNPDFAQDSDRVRNGVGYDADGTPLGMYFVSHHPGRQSPGGKPGWTYVPLYDEAGLPVLISYVHRQFPEQVVGVGYAPPVMVLVKQLHGVIEAHVIAKRMQMAVGMIFEVDDPKAAARADRNGEVLTKNTRFAPGKVYYVKRGTLIKFLDVKYNGKDLRDFILPILEFICSGYGPGMPRQYVLRQLTESNLASARAALMQAWRGFRSEQNNQINELLLPMVQCLLAEDLARGRLVLPTGDDIFAASRGSWVRPPRLSTDDYREMQAAEAKQRLGWALTSIHGEHDSELQSQAEQRVRDNLLFEMLGLDDASATGSLPDLPEDDEDEPKKKKPADDDDDELDDDDEPTDEDEEE